MTDPVNDPAYCPNCITFGFPILLSRYAVARADQDVRRPAPALVAPFGAGVQDIALPAADARYTLRLLRGGYVYAYNEARDEWLAWQVNEHGDLSAFDIRDATPPPQSDDTPARCSRHGSALFAKCIVVPDAAFGTALWVAFSTAPWTQRVWQRHRDARYRARTMRRIDVGRWAASATAQPHVAALHQAVDQVAEFHAAAADRPRSHTPDVTNLPTVNVLPGAKTLEHSLCAPDQYSRAQIDLLSAQARLAGRQVTPGHPLAVAPALVALDDPVGIIADLNQLAIARILEWENEPERQEKRQSAAAIAALQAAIGQGALEDEAHRRGRNARLGRGVVTVLGGRTGSDQLARPLPTWTNDVFAVQDEAEVLQFGQASWKKYRRHLRDDDGHARWLTQTYAVEQQAFYEKNIAALDDAYIAWLSATAFRQHMTGHFDSANTTSGVLYQEVVTTLLRDATSRGKVFQYVLDCLTHGDPLDPDAIVLRAQMWNQDGLIAVWKDTLSDTSTAPGARDWLVAANGLSNALKGLLDAETDAKLGGMFQGTARLVEQLSGPMSRIIGTEIGSLVAQDVGRLPARWQVGLLTALAQSASPGTELVDLVGHTTPKRARKALAMRLAAHAGLNSAQQAAAAAAEVIETTDVDIRDGRFRFGMVALVDADRLRLFKALNAKAVITGPGRQAELMRTLTVLDLHDAMRASLSNLGSTSLGYGMAGLVLASASLGQLHKQFATATADTRGMLAANFSAGVAALLGDAAMVMGEVGTKLPWFSQKLAEPMGRWMFRADTKAAVVKAGGRWLSGVAGVVLGALTFADGYRDAKLNRAYGISMMGLGFVGALASALMMSGYGIPVAIILLIVVAIVTVVVAWFKPDGVQRWLDKTMHFGGNKTGCFADLESQNAALRALRADQGA
ncbi:T6SS effector BTH_I2691 family protein [Stenotrophomonas sp. GZD-301]|uniref:T6SS effector BTH_I2691 family protein n=1 Tax=Stenotrophomonas sp. GZD-301 TaxID=3404814 RepID=UPI003BB669B4